MAQDEFDHVFIAPSDFDNTLAFYTSTLGWAVTSQWGSKGEGRGATIATGKMQLVIAEKHTGDTDDDSNKAINGSRPTLYVAVDDLEARFAAMKDKTSVVVPLSKTHWGIFWYVIRDPDGNLIAFTHRSNG